MVVLPASGWEMMAKVLRFEFSSLRCGEVIGFLLFLMRWQSLLEERVTQYQEIDCTVWVIAYT